MDNTLRFVFTDEGGGGNGSPPSRPSVPEPVPGDAAKGGGGGARRPGTDGANSLEGYILERATDAIGRKLETLPVLGKTVEILNDIASHTKILEEIKSGGDIVRTILDRGRTLPGGASGAGGAARSAGAAAGAAEAEAGGATAGGLTLAGAAAEIVPPLLAVAAVVGGAIIVTKVLIETNNALRRTFEKVSDKIRPFSPDILGSDARNEVARLRLEIDQARHLGGRVARFNDAQAKLDRSLSRIATAIEGPLLDVVNPLIERAAAVIEGASHVADAVGKLGTMLDLFRPLSIKLLDLQNKALGIAQRKENELPPELDILGAFSREKMLPVTWNGRTFGADEAAAVPGSVNAGRVPREFLK